jgi:antitoxin (DNA-binding transcriptional repressor) of toxin-antitoxin stability system
VPKKSDKRRDRRISATVASRTFSKLLDEVESGRRFRVHRRGRDVCAIVPPPVHGRRASECLALIRARPPVLLDDRFGRDLLAVLAKERVEERPKWDS